MKFYDVALIFKSAFKWIYGVMLVSLGLSACVSQPGVSAMSLVRYDGVYVSGHQFSGGEGYWGYLRFYSDNAVIAVSSTGCADHVIKWFDRGHPYVSSGKFTVRDRAISFTTTQKKNDVDYVGEVIDDRLHLESFGHITRVRVTEDYVFVPMALAASFRMPGETQGSADSDRASNGKAPRLCDDGTGDDKSNDKVYGSPQR